MEHGNYSNSTSTTTHNKPATDICHHKDGMVKIKKLTYNLTKILITSMST